MLEPRQQTPKHLPILLPSRPTLPKKVPPVPRTVHPLPRNLKPTRAYPPLPLPTPKPPPRPPRAQQRRPRLGLNLPKQQQAPMQMLLAALPTQPVALLTLPLRRQLQQNPVQIMRLAVQRLPKTLKLPLPNLPRGQPTRRLPPRRHRTPLRPPRPMPIPRPAAQAKRPQPPPTVPQRLNPARLLPLIVLLLLRQVKIPRRRARRKQKHLPRRLHWMACTRPCWTAPIHGKSLNCGGRLP